MFIFRSILLFSLVSICAAFGLLVLGSAAGYEEFSDGYAVLSVDSSIEDRQLLEILNAGRSGFGGNFISESTQWVMLDNFGSLEKVPLDQYTTRILSFDPRNDGYADKLKSVFVRDGKRFVYVPLKTGNMAVNLPDKQFASLLEDIPYSVEYYGVGKPLFLFFAAYAAASLCLLIICYVKRNIHHGALGIIVLIPVISSLAFFGAAGIAAAAMLFGLFFLLREPLHEFIMLPGLFSKEKTNKMRLIYKDILKPYKFYWIVLGLFVSALGVITVFSQLKLLFLIAVFTAALLVFFFFCRTMSRLDGNHTRFTPVVIIKRRVPEFAFSFYMLPFAVSVFIVMLFTPYMSGTLVFNEKFDNIIEEMDYYAHLNYQASFSTRQIGTYNADFPSFKLDPDGLPSLNGINNFVINKNDFPSFPLGNLMDFFKGVNNGKTDASAVSNVRMINDFSLLVLLLFVIPGLFIKRKNDNLRKIDISGYKNVSGQQRLKGIRKKTYGFNSRNQLRILKDA